MITFTRLSRFSACNIENWEELGDEATVKVLLSRIMTEDTSKVYQGATLLHYGDEMFSCYSRQVLEGLLKLSESIKHCLAWSDTKLLCSILVFLDTRSWTAP